VYYLAAFRASVAYDEHLFDTFNAFASDLSTKLILEACSFRVGAWKQMYYYKF